MLPYSNATRAPTANPPNSAQLGGSLYHARLLHPGPCSSVGVRPRTDTHRHTHTDTQTRVTTIHFASSTTHAKCNEPYLRYTNVLFTSVTYTCRTLTVCQRNANATRSVQWHHKDCRTTGYRRRNTQVVKVI